MHRFLVALLGILLLSSSMAVAQTTPRPPAATPQAQPAQSALIDINRALKEQLDGLPGVGAARADAIIKGRPYKRKDELVDRKIIPQNVYNGIKERIVAHQM